MKWKFQLPAVRTILGQKAPPRAGVEEDINELLEFEKKVAAIVRPEVERSNITRIFNLRKASELKKLLPIVRANSM